MKKVGAFSLSTACLSAAAESSETRCEKLSFGIASMAKADGKKRFLREIKKAVGRKKFLRQIKKLQRGRKE